MQPDFGRITHTNQFYEYKGNKKENKGDNCMNGDWVPQYEPIEMHAKLVSQIAYQTSGHGISSLHFPFQFSSTEFSLFLSKIAGLFTSSFSLHFISSSLFPHQPNSFLQTTKTTSHHNTLPFHFLVILQAKDCELRVRDSVELRKNWVSFVFSFLLDRLYELLLFLLNRIERGRNGWAEGTEEKKESLWPCECEKEEKGSKLDYLSGDLKFGCSSLR